MVVKATVRRRPLGPVRRKPELQAKQGLISWRCHKWESGVRFGRQVELDVIRITVEAYIKKLIKLTENIFSGSK